MNQRLKRKPLNKQKVNQSESRLIALFHLKKCHLTKNTTNCANCLEGIKILLLL